MAEYTHPLWLGDPAEHGLYQDLIKVYRGEIKGKEARDIVNAATGEFPQQAFDSAKREAIQRTDTPQGRISTYNSRTDFKKLSRKNKSWPMITNDGIQNAYIKDNKIHAEGSKFDGMKATEGNLRKAFVLPKDLNEIPANVDWNLLRDTNKSPGNMMADIYTPASDMNSLRNQYDKNIRIFKQTEPGLYNKLMNDPNAYEQGFNIFLESLGLVRTSHRGRTAPDRPVMLPGTNLERRGPKGTFRDFYPGDNMNPNNVMPNAVYQNNMPGGMLVQNRNNQPNNILVKLATMQKLGLLA